MACKRSGVRASLSPPSDKLMVSRCWYNIGMTVIVKNLAINYRDSGKGKVILFLHGWQSDLQAFNDIAAKLGGKHRLVLVDLPGFGGSELPKNAWDLDNYIEFVVAFLAKLKISKTHAIVAHSMGCRIAMKGVGRGLLNTKRLVLIGAHGIRESQSFRNRLFWLAAKTGKLVTSPLPRRARLVLKQQLYKSANATDYLDAGALKGSFTKIINEDVRPEAAMISVPTLLIYGKTDTVTPPHYGKIFQKIIDKSRLELVPEAGHYAHTDKPQTVFSLVEQFIK